MGEARDLTVDVLVVGSGNGALTAALCAYELGLRDVLVIEKSPLYGGTSATSGGGIWIPCSRYARAAGASDSYDEALSMCAARRRPGRCRRACRRPTCRRARRCSTSCTSARVCATSHSRTIRITGPSLPGAKHGHRSLEPQPLARSALGADAAQLRDTHHMMWMFDRIAMTQVDAQVLMAQLPGWKGLAARRVWDHVSDLPWALTHKRSRRIACGCAGIARLRWSMQDRRMPLWLEASLTELLADDAGRVCGACVAQGGTSVTVRARRAVVLAAGGFEHNQQMRERYLPQPTDTRWSAAAGTNTGDAHRAAMALGAATRLMDGGWWCSSIRAPDDPVPRLAIMDKSYPGNIVVTRRGRRIANESQNYITYQLEFYRRHTPEDPQAPSWMIFDARSRRMYFNGPLWPTRYRPDWRLPRAYFTSGFLTRADSIRGAGARRGHRCGGTRADRGGDERVRAHRQGSRARSRRCRIRSLLCRSAHQAQSVPRADRRAAVLRDAHRSG